MRSRSAPSLRLLPSRADRRPANRRLAFARFVNGAGPIERIEDVSEVFDDEAAIAGAINELA